MTTEGYVFGCELKRKVYECDRHLIGGWRSLIPDSSVAIKSSLVFSRKNLIFLYDLTDDKCMHIHRNHLFCHQLEGTHFCNLLPIKGIKTNEPIDFMHFWSPLEWPICSVLLLSFRRQRCSIPFVLY